VWRVEDNRTRQVYNFNAYHESAIDVLSDAEEDDLMPKKAMKRCYT